MNEGYKEVRYDLYCKKCKYGDLSGDEEPCWECLSDSIRMRSDKPHKFEEK